MNNGTNGTYETYEEDEMIEMIGTGLALVDGIVFVIEQPKGAGK